MLFFGLPLLERQRRSQAQRDDRDRVLEEALHAAATAQAQLAGICSRCPHNSNER